MMDFLKNEWYETYKKMIHLDYDWDYDRKVSKVLTELNTDLESGLLQCYFSNSLENHVAENSKVKQKYQKKNYNSNKDTLCKPIKKEDNYNLIQCLDNFSYSIPKDNSSLPEPLKTESFAGFSIVTNGTYFSKSSFKARDSQQKSIRKETQSFAGFLVVTNETDS